MSAHFITLSNGNKIPSLGLGTYSPSTSPSEAANAVKAAIKAGYRHIDAAAVYKNEKEIGEALKELFDEGIVKREDLFITSKLWVTEHDPNDAALAFHKTLKDLQLSYLDLYLIHWPIPLKRGTKEFAGVPIIETWKVLENFVDAGMIKNIGVSNFGGAQLLDLVSACRIKPVVNQVELHPFLTQTNLQSFSQKLGVILVAYSPILRADKELMTNPVLVEIAQKYSKTVAQVTLKYLIQRRIPVIPKSYNESRIISNADLFDFEMTDAEISAINGLNKDYRRTDSTSFLGVDAFA